MKGKENVEKKFKEGLDEKVRLETLSGLDKRLLVSGLAGISPIPVVGEIGMYFFIDSILENYSAFSSRVGKLIAIPAAILTRFYGVYPMYTALYKFLGDGLK